MQTPLRIETVHLDPQGALPRILDMPGRCAFAICTNGRFGIRVLNDSYIVTAQCMFACMPFVHIEVVEVSEPSEVIFGYILIKDVPSMINRWIDTTSLSAIQSNLMVKISDDRYHRIIHSINEFMVENYEKASGINELICSQLQRDIVDFQSRLIVAKVLQTYLEEISFVKSNKPHNNEVFQRFMLALYGNFREHRTVQFYADKSGVSLKYFSTLVRQLSGASPSEWIETVVVEEAKSMLSDNQNTIKDISTALNFPDAPTFTKYFRRITGLTPKAYRKTLL